MANFLAWAGKELLVKTVAQVIPNYTMSCILLLKHFCEDLNKLIDSFCGMGTMASTGFISILGQTLYSKVRAGSWFRNLYAFNIGMLANQGWRIMLVPNSLGATILKAKHFPNCSFLNAPMNSDAFFAGKVFALLAKSYGKFGKITKF